MGGSGEKIEDGITIYATHFGAHYEIVGGEEKLASILYSIRNGLRFTNVFLTLNANNVIYMLIMQAEMVSVTTFTTMTSLRKEGLECWHLSGNRC